MVKAEGKNVDDASPHAVLPGFVDEVDLFKVIRQQHLIQEIHGVGLPQGDREGLVAELFPGDDLFCQGLWKGHHQETVPSTVDLVQDFCPHGDVGILDRGLFAVGNTCRPRVKEHGAPVFQNRLEVVHEVGRLFLVVKDKHMVPRMGQFVFVGQHPCNGQRNG